eukprot:gnl/Spiro4/5966_TR3054_c0_g1_i1.p1 gnl/Spiro4/5966_TR3054_c0_g1~~gnl/Spiro4/5966_TR3054_c0_g1_i1.p1  ORF type:complete len:370 (-),score=99.56 gnl/Spiro4/5966_TR3054_c0_g1_i1:333-1361(-)
MEHDPCSFVVVFWSLANVTSSVGIILLNKYLMDAFHFGYFMTLTGMHMIFGYFFLLFLARAGVFEIAFLQPYDRWLLSSYQTASICFMNASLLLNSVGVYQMSKLACIPATLSIQAYFYGEKVSAQVKLILLAILVGVGVCTVTDLRFNAEGTLIGCAAVITTALAQVERSKLQKRYGMSALQIQFAETLPCAALSLVGAVMLDGGLLGDPEHSVIRHFEKASRGEFVLICATCLASISVNYTGFTLIAMTSPVTFQVIGHAKTIVILLSGALFFSAGKPLPPTTIVAAAFALWGVIVYTEIKHAATKAEPNWCDTFLPECVLSLVGRSPAALDLASPSSGV